MTGSIYTRSHWDVGTEKTTFMAVGTRGPAIALHLTTYNGGQVFSYNAKDDEHSDIPLQKTHAIGVLRGVLGL